MPLRLNAQERSRWLSAIHGRLREAERLNREFVDATLRVRGDTISAHVVAWLPASLYAVLAGDTRRGVAMLDSAFRARPVASYPVDRDASIWGALAYAYADAPAKAGEILNQHIARLDSLGRLRDYVAIERVRSVIALDEGRIDSAIIYARRSDTEPDGLPTANCAPCMNAFLGVAYDRAGRTDSARIYLTRYVDSPSGPTLDVIYYAPALFRLGQLYRDAGDSKHAIDYYNRFIDLWKNADPELQPRVAQARKELAELIKEKN